jgi:hypothetical protein
VTDNQSLTSRILKSLGVLLLILFGLAIAVNHYVRVAGPGERSTGILIDWMGGKFRSSNFKHYETSAAFSGRAVDILVRYGADILADNPEMTKEREKAMEYLRTALTATQSVEDEYLKASHKELPEAYRKYEESLRLFLLGAERQDLQYFREATPLYNGFLAFMREHKDEFRHFK